MTLMTQMFYILYIKVNKLEGTIEINVCFEITKGPLYEKKVIMLKHITKQIIKI